MNLNSIVSNLKNFVFLAVPTAIAMTYLGVTSYYLNYNIDISTYLGFEDLTIIYSKYTVFSMLYLLLIYVAVKKFFREKKTESFWDKTIFKTRIKRRVFPGIIIIATLIYCVVKYETFRLLISIVFLSLVFFSLTKQSVYNSLVLNQSTDEIEKEDNIVSVIFLIIITVFLIPLLAGNAFNKLNTRESVIIYLENNKTVDAQKYSNIKFIGKTSKFVFLQDSISKSTFVYSIEKINNLEYCDSQQNTR